MIEDKEFLNEVFDLATAKGYDFEVTDMSTVTIPEVRYQATFEASNGVEYAFRVYRADSMPGRKYGPHSRLLTFMRKKSRNFSQNITVDMGTFKKVLVTFMRCYQDYKENSKDGKKSSSYAVVMQDSLRAYAPLFVRATKRAFRTNKRLQLSLVGVNEEGKGNTLELMYKNTQSVFPAFGGRDYDEAKFVGNPTHVELAKIAGKEVELKQPDQTDVAGTPTVAPLQTSAISSVAHTKDRFNPDGIEGLNDPTVFMSKEFIDAAFMAPGRDALESVFKKFKIHRRYFAHRIKDAVNLWKMDHYVSDYYSNSLYAQILDGVGFYIKRDYPEKMVDFVRDVVKNNHLITLDEMKDVIEQYKISDLDGYTNVTRRFIDQFARLQLNPLQPTVKSEFEKLKFVLESLSISIYNLNSVIVSQYTSGINQFIAFVVLNALDDNTISSDEIIRKFGTNGVLVFAHDDYDNIMKQLNMVQITPKVVIQKIKYVDPNDTLAALKSAFVNKSINDLIVILRDTYNLDVKTPKSFDNLNMIKDNIKGFNIDATTMIDVMFEFAQKSYSNQLAMNLFEIVNSFLENVNKISVSDYAQYIKSYYFSSNTNVHTIMFEKSINTTQDVIDLFALFEKHNEASSTSFESFIRIATERNLLTNDMIFDKMSNNLIDEGGDYYERRNKQSIISALSRSMHLLTADQLHKFYLKAAEVSANKISNVYNTLTVFVDKVDNGVFEKVMEKLFMSGDDKVESLVKYMINSVSGRNIAYGDDNAEKVAILYDLAQSHGLLNDDVRTRLGKQIATQSLFGGLENMRKHMSDTSIIGTIRHNAYQLKYVSDDAEFDESVDGKFIDAIIEGMTNETGFGERMNYRREVQPNEQIPDVLNVFNSSMLNKLSDASIARLKELFATVKATSTTKRTVYQPMLDKMADLLSEADVSNRPNLSQELLDVLDDRERRLLVKSVGKGFFINRYISEFRDKSKIKMNVNLNHKSVSSILNFNNISMATLPNISEKDNIESVKKKVGKVQIGVPDEKVEQINLTEDQLLDLTVEYDAFNRKKHNLSLVFKEAFNVSIPSQVQGRAEWDKKMADEGIDSRIMNPVFHGTGSVAAAMILRLGFAVSSLKDTEKTGVKIAGRMLGDGIYFSTAIDKVAQYASDGGFGRKIGDEGYIFEMNASLGKHRRDFREAGTNSQYSERSVVSPEWAVFSPNQQLVINKAYKIKRVPHHVLDKIKASRKLVNESKNVTGIRGFRDVIRENLNYGTENMITFIFSDDRIPLADGTLVDFADYKGQLGKQARVEGGQLGTMVTFINVPDNMVNADEVDIYHIALSGSFVETPGDELLERYMKLAKRP